MYEQQQIVAQYESLLDSLENPSPNWVGVGPDALLYKPWELSKEQLATLDPHDRWSYQKGDSY